MPANAVLAGVKCTRLPQLRLPGFPPPRLVRGQKGAGQKGEDPAPPQPPSPHLEARPAFRCSQTSGQGAPWGVGSRCLPTPPGFGASPPGSGTQPADEGGAATAGRGRAGLNPGGPWRGRGAERADGLRTGPGVCRWDTGARRAGRLAKPKLLRRARPGSAAEAGEGMRVGLTVVPSRAV